MNMMVHIKSESHGSTSILALHQPVLISLQETSHHQKTVALHHLHQACSLGCWGQSNGHQRTYQDEVTSQQIMSPIPVSEEINVFSIVKIHKWKDDLFRFYVTEANPPSPFSSPSLPLLQKEKGFKMFTLKDNKQNGDSILKRVVGMITLKT